MLETLLTLTPQRGQAFFHRTAGGAEIDLVIDHPGGERWAIEVKRSLMPALSRGVHQARPTPASQWRQVLRPWAELSNT